MIQIEKALSVEMTRKQFVVTLLTAFSGLFGIATFIGAFTKSTSSQHSQRPGYGKQHYGP